MFHHTLGGPKLRDEEGVYSIRGHQSKGKSQPTQRTSMAASLCDSNPNQPDHNNGSIPKNTKEERSSFRKLARNLLFSSDQDPSDNYSVISNSDQYLNSEYSYGTHHNHGKSRLESLYWKNPNPKPSKPQTQLQSHVQAQGRTYSGDEYTGDLARLFEDQHRQAQNQARMNNHNYNNGEYKQQLQLQQLQQLEQLQPPVPCSHRHHSHSTSHYNMKTADGYTTQIPKSRDREFVGSRSTGNSKVLQKNEGVINVNGYNKSKIDKRPLFKTVAITSIPKKMSLSALISQLYGGPIERVELVRKDNYSNYYDDESLKYKVNQPINWNESSVFLHFLRTDHARNFYQYSKTELFKVNDVHLKTTWIPYKLENVEEKEDFDNENENSIEKKEEDNIVRDLMKGPEQARRILVFKKLIHKNRNEKHGKRRTYADSTLNYSVEFDVEEINRDFSPYGKLVEILPVVSRKLCFGLQYYDVRSSITVKNIIQNGYNGLNEKGLNSRDVELRVKYHNWGVWYGKDPADRGVPI